MFLETEFFFEKPVIHLTSINRPQTLKHLALHTREKCQGDDQTHQTHTTRFYYQLLSLGCIWTNMPVPFDDLT